jgi:hypothetical protein
MMVLLKWTPKLRFSFYCAKVNLKLTPILVLDVGKRQLK